MRLVKNLLVTAAIFVPFLTAGAEPAVDSALSASAPTPDNKAHALIVEHAAKLRTAWAASGPHPATVIFPSVVSGRILTPTVDVQKAPGQPIVQLTIESGLVGISNVSVTLSSPSGLHSITDPNVQVPSYPAAARRTIDILVQSPFANGGLGPYSESGPWKVTNVMLTPESGDFISYDADQLTVLFPSLTVHVTNANPADITPPITGAGKILTPSVSLKAAAPVFAVSLPVGDKLSGVMSVNILITPPGATFPSLGAFAELTAPLHWGAVTASVQLDPKRQVPGTYTITGIDVCDFAANCRQESSPAAIKKALGATTFRVTK
jgi:hypothetical protein